MIESLGRLYKERRDELRLEHARRIARILNLYLERSRHELIKGKRPQPIPDEVGVKIIKNFEETFDTSHWPAAPPPQPAPKDSAGHHRLAAKRIAETERKKKAAAEARRAKLAAAEIREKADAHKRPTDALKVKDKGAVADMGAAVK